MNENMQVKKSNRRRGGFIAGAVLITIGVFNLLANVLEAEWSLWLVLAIGVTFLIAGIVGKSRGLLIPGGIVSGVGAGIVAIEKLGASLVEPGEGGLFLLVFSLGWLLISVMSLFIPEEDGSRDFMWWPLIPGGIMAAIGGLLFAGSTGLTVLTWIGQGWPVILIGIGLYLLLRRKELKDEE